jgi:hypothetical protein
MHEFQDDKNGAGKALERQADRLLGPEFSMWRGATIEDTGPPEGEPDDGRRHRPFAIESCDPHKDYVPRSWSSWARTFVPAPPSAQNAGSKNNSQLEMLHFAFGVYKPEDHDVWLWYVMTDPDPWHVRGDPPGDAVFSTAGVTRRNDDEEKSAGVPAVGVDDGFVAPRDHDPHPVCSTGFFTISLRRRRKEYAREQGEVFRPRRRFTRTKPKLAQPHRVKAALMKLRA